MEYNFIINEQVFTVNTDFEALNSFVDSILWEDNKYTSLYSLDIGKIDKEAYVHQVSSLKSLLKRIENNTDLLQDYLQRIEVKDGKFALNSGYTITVAKNLAEYITGETEAWKVLELRLEASSELTCEMRFVSRMKSRR